jgi:hypothetical protein
MPKRKRWKKNFNVILGTIIFALLIGTAFSVDWIFGAGFVVGFFLSVWNKILERNFLIPAFIFAGALIIRYAIKVLLPDVLNAQDYFSLGISLILFLLILFMGWKIRRGKFRF